MSAGDDTWVRDRWGGPAGAAAPAADQTHVLDRVAEAAAVDPFAATQVVVDPSGSEVPDAPGALGAGADPTAALPPPLLSRRQAAEAGLYAGGSLVLLAVGWSIAQGWSGWDATMRAATLGLAAVAMLAVGLFVRLPWPGRPGDERRRAVSTLLTGGVGLALVAGGVSLGVSQSTAGPSAGAHAVVGVLAMLGVCVVARSALAEVGLLVACAWAAWLLVPPGPATWASLVVLGVAWAALGSRWAKGRRTAMIAGVGVALLASIGLAQNALAWPTRAGLAALVAVGLVKFLRGGANAWLALGAGAAAALAAAVAGASLGPALALLIGGAATMTISGIALRSARRAA